jgi:hypothetical protein
MPARSSPQEATAASGVAGVLDLTVMLLAQMSSTRRTFKNGTHLLLSYGNAVTAVDVRAAILTQSCHWLGKHSAVQLHGVQTLHLCTVGSISCVGGTALMCNLFMLWVQLLIALRLRLAIDRV